MPTVPQGEALELPTRFLVAVSSLQARQHPSSRRGPCSTEPVPPDTVVSGPPPGLAQTPGFSALHSSAVGGSADTKRLRHAAESFVAPVCAPGREPASQGKVESG